MPQDMVRTEGHVSSYFVLVDELIICLLCLPMHRDCANSCSFGSFLGASLPSVLFVGQVIFLLGHWNNEGLGCSQGMPLGDAFSCQVGQVTR